MTTPTQTAIVRQLSKGTLTVGAVGSPIDFSGRCASVAITWKVDSSDGVEVLSGDTIGGDREYVATLEAKVYQDDLRDGSLVTYSWANKGAEVPFTFTPWADGGVAITGKLVVDPLDFGGDIGKKNTSDIKWTCVGEPTIVDDLS